MIFFFKKPKIVLDCFTYEESIIRTAPVDFATKHYPEWWKKLPNSYKKNAGFQDHGTMKTCAGFLEYYKKSIALPLWSELLLVIENRNYFWQFSDQRTQADVHDEQQKQGFAPAKDFGHMKIVSPWKLKTAESINWVWSHAIYNFETPNDFFVLPGIVDYSYVDSTNINIIIPLEKDRRFTVGYGQPMAHITPMTEKEIEIRRHLISKDKFDSMNTYNSEGTFLNAHAQMKVLKQKFSKCPFADERKQ